LIAEEVDRVYPELVIRDEKGDIEGVRYDELAPMLLNVVQQQQARIAADERTMETQAHAIAELRDHATAVDVLEEQMAELRNVNAQIMAALAQGREHGVQSAMR